MIPDHLKDLNFNRDDFYVSKFRKKGKAGVQIGLTLEGALRLAHQRKLQRLTQEVCSVTTQDDLGLVVITKTTVITSNGQFESLGTACNAEFKGNQWGGEEKIDRRKFFIAKMAASRATTGAIETALNITMEDAHQIVLEKFPDLMEGIQQDYDKQEEKPVEDVVEEEEEAPTDLNLGI